MRDDTWMREGSCSTMDPDVADPIFFPRKKKGKRRDYTAAKQICRACPVRTSCLAFAIAHNVPYGVWGGFSDDERKAIAPSRRRALRRAWHRLHPGSDRNPLSAGRR